MKKQQRLSIIEFAKKFSTDKKCREYLFQKKWKNGFVCPKCGSIHYCELSNGLYQCNDCHHQTSVTAGTILHRTHVPLTKWFLAFYFVTQDKRGISAVQLSRTLDVTYKTAWYIIKRIRCAMKQRDINYLLLGTIEFDDTYIGDPTVGKKRGRGTEKSKVFVAVSIDKKGRPKHLKMQTTDNIQQRSVRKFAQANIQAEATIISDGYRSYIPALKDYKHEHGVYNPDAGMLHWLHTMIGNAKAFIIGTYHGLPKKNLQEYLDEFCYRFNRRHLTDLCDRLTNAIALSSFADLKG